MLEIRQVATTARWAALLITASCLAACGQSSPVSGNSTAAATTTAPSATAAPTLTMTGTPAGSVVAGSAYTFQPAVSESSGTVTLSVTGLPAWATFNTGTGELTGTPSSADVGTTGPITINASDGGTTASIGPFTIEVTAAAGPPPATGSATLYWVAPTENTDGSALTDLAGYHIYYGTSADALTQTIDVSAATTTYVISSLAAGTYYFAVAAYSSGGTESAQSNVASKTI